MTLTQVLTLGLVQGLTEFLPISSSGHLVIVQNWFGFTKPPVAFDVLLHVATLVAVGGFFWKDIQRLDRKLLQAILVGTIPTVAIGLLLEQKAQVMFASSSLLGAGYLVTTLILLSTMLVPKVHLKMRASVDLGSALLIGIAQGVSIVPSISRSGATIVTALWLGVERKEATKFSFLLSIPAIIGAQLLELPELFTNGEFSFPMTTIGFFTALIAGWFSLGWLVALIKGARLHWFAIYTGLLAVLSILV